ncbi:DUF1367 family protein [Stappia indica]|uniref:DUF1367 family protein n=1 Tax=Stappia indica TaxID=538381 RepID=UPI001CD31192|nr:DUF1367 family protein [Stappia indica]MCA1298000.1 DUF1367 family protein [Stappia indica]
MTKQAAFSRAYVPSLGSVLVPLDADGREMVEAMTAGKPAMVRLHTPRNIKHHRMFFALLRMATDSGAWDSSEETLRDAIKIACGCVDTIIGLDGRTYFKPRSMSFESMSQAEFSRFFDRAVFYVSTHLLGDANWQAVRDRIGEMVDGDLGRRATEVNGRWKKSA